jgi:hypothetical protein
MEEVLVTVMVLFFCIFPIVGTVFGLYDMSVSPNACMTSKEVGMKNKGVHWFPYSWVELLNGVMSGIYIAAGVVFFVCSAVFVVVILTPVYGVNKFLNRG